MMMITDPNQLLARVRRVCSTSGCRQHPRNGKVARLPHALREQINQMIDDGFPYKAILEKLQEPGAPPLPYPISEMNLSNWRRGGYQEWRLEQEERQFLARVGVAGSAGSSGKLQ
jgi:hypothetical protein